MRKAHPYSEPEAVIEIGLGGRDDLFGDMRTSYCCRVKLSNVRADKPIRIDGAGGGSESDWFGDCSAIGERKGSQSCVAI